MPQFGESDLYHFTDRGTVNGEAFRNDYWYVAVTPSTRPPLPDVLSEFEGLVVGAIVELQNSLTIHQYVRVERHTVSEPTVQYEAVSGYGAGGLAGAASPSMECVGIRLLVSTKETRPGQKRIPGLVEGDVANNNLEAASLAAWVAIKDVFDTPIDLVGYDLLSPCVVRNRETINGQQVPLPPASWTWNYINGVYVQPTVRSQVSRKPRTS